MLTTLSIRDVVLIEKLDLTFGSGLTVLTGETGAGKSILLDSLGLALGERADSGLVRQGADQASVTAVFEDVGDLLTDVLGDYGLSPDMKSDGLIVKRILGVDGRSRAFVNGEPTTISALRAIGSALAEVHGQFENQRLLSPSAHRGLLDAYGALQSDVGKTADTWRIWQDCEAAVVEAEQALEQARRDEDFLRHALDEISKMAPQPDEEKELAEARAFMMNGEKFADAINSADSALSQGKGVGTALQSAMRHLIQLAEKAEGRFNAAIEILDRAGAEVAEASAELARLSIDLDLDPSGLERTEERLFALRALARKHGVEVDALAQLQNDMAAQLSAIEDGGADIIRLKREAATARQGYDTAADQLGDRRRKAAGRLQKSITKELEPLKLGNAVFVAAVEGLGESEWGQNGKDKIAFLIATNPGNEPGPIGKVASGGELARLMLALKVVLASAQADPIPTIVFDEVDSGIGGATAAAVGERLAALADDVQVLVVTHSPQVAAMGVHHWRVSKQGATNGGSVRTSVDVLDAALREEEIARMLSGTEITIEARAAALSLLKGGNPRQPGKQGDAA